MQGSTCCISINYFRWYLVVHGSVDGYSRLVVYVKCSDNNTAVTVFQCFTEAVLSYGLPSRVRSDWGGENVNVANFMLQHPERGPGRGHHSLQDGVCITSAMSAYGVMYFKGAYSCSTTYFST